MSDFQSRYSATLAAIKMSKAEGLVDLTQEDFDFVSASYPWTAKDRLRAVRSLESVVFGSLDYLGLPRFSPPVEYLAGVIASYVSPVNIMTACSFFDGSEWLSNIIRGEEEPVRANTLFSHVLATLGGDWETIDRKHVQATTRLREIGQIEDAEI